MCSDWCACMHALVRVSKRARVSVCMCGRRRACVNTYGHARVGERAGVNMYAHAQKHKYM